METVPMIPAFNCFWQMRTGRDDNIVYYLWGAKWKTPQLEEERSWGIDVFKRKVSQPSNMLLQTDTGSNVECNLPVIIPNSYGSVGIISAVNVTGTGCRTRAFFVYSPL